MTSSAGNPYKITRCDTLYGNRCTYNFFLHSNDLINRMSHGLWMLKALYSVTVFILNRFAVVLQHRIMLRMSTPMPALRKYCRHIVLYFNGLLDFNFIHLAFEDFITKWQRIILHWPRLYNNRQPTTKPSMNSIRTQRSGRNMFTKKKTITNIGFHATSKLPCS